MLSFADQIDGKPNLLPLLWLAIECGGDHQTQCGGHARLLSFKNSYIEKGLIMITENFKARVIATAWILAMASLHGHALAQPTSSRGGSDTQAASDTVDGKAEAAAMKHVDDAVAVVRRIESEPGLNTLLQHAKGVFIVPTYARVALGVGGGGGTGVLLVKRDSGAWSDPGFYNIGGISLGAQVGAQSGPIVMVLNNDKAVNSFLQKNKFSLSADAGLTVVNWAKVAQGSVGAGDIVVWAGTKGLFGNVVSIGVNDIRFDQKETDAYYHKVVTASDVVSGAVKNPQADTLKQALAASSASTSSGSSGADESRGASGEDSDRPTTPASKK